MIPFTCDDIETELNVCELTRRANTTDRFLGPVKRVVWKALDCTLAPLLRIHQLARVWLPSNR